MGTEHRLSFCKVVQISDDIFEIFVDQGAEVCAKCAEEEYNFWMKLRDEPFRILLNCTTSFSYDFEGAQKIGKAPHQEKIGIVVYNDVQYQSSSMAITLNKMTFPDKSIRVFENRENALAWLSEGEALKASESTELTGGSV